MILSDSERMRRADRIAIDEYAVPSPALMERAAAHLARAAMEEMGRRRAAVVFCGSGNNGGDGVAAAALLRQRGVAVRAFLVGSREKMTADTSRMEQWLRRVGGTLEDFDPDLPELPEILSGAGAIIDAIFGIGLRRPLSGPAAAAAERINASEVPVIAADIPSGVAADTGAVLGTAVKADRTLTFSMAKPGHFTEPGCVYCGRVEICDIGIPASVLAGSGCGVFAVDRPDVSLPRRDRLSHKGDFGRVMLLGGSVGYTGAPCLSAAAAVRAGAGLVSLGVPEAVWSVCAGVCREAMPFPLPCDEAGRLTSAALPLLRERWAGCDVLAVGPGLGRSGEIVSLTQEIVRTFPKTLVLDADALWAVSAEPELLRQRPGPTVITPHAGEFHRLGGDITGGRLADARAFAETYGCVTVLKGHRTIVAFPTGDCHVITAGNPGMAKGGSGDVLTGVMAAMLGQLPPEKAVVTAAWLHAAAGDHCAAARGEYGMTPSDIIDALPETMKEITMS